jgi:hypothetical protein
MKSQHIQEELYSQKCDYLITSPFAFTSVRFQFLQKPAMPFVPLAQIMNEVAIKCLHASFELLKVIGFSFHSPRARSKINFD